MTKNPVIVKDHDNPSEHCFSLDVINNEGRLPHHVPVKVTINTRSNANNKIMEQFVV